MSFTRIPDLPNNVNVTPNSDYLVIEQDITRKITPSNFLTKAIPGLPAIPGGFSLTPTTDLIPITDNGSTAYNITVQDLFSKSIPNLTNTTQLFPTDLVPISDNGVAKNIQVQDFSKYLFQNPPDIKNCFWVSKSGDDANFTGKNEDSSFLTIERAAQAISALRAAGDTNPYTIFVRSGDYQEYNPIYLPPKTSIIGDGLRRVSITPKNANSDILWVGDACYVWGITFKGHLAPAAAVAFPIPATAANNLTAKTVPYYFTTAQANAMVNQAYGGNYPIASGAIPIDKISTTVSPYIQGCTSYANETNPATGSHDAGCGMRIDGELVNSKIRSMVLDSFTQINQGGKGILITNHGYAQLVSIFTVCTTEGVLCERGGTCSISTSNCTFGLSGLVARGGTDTATWTEGILRGVVNGSPTTSNTNIYDSIIVTVNNTTNLATEPYSGMFFTIGAKYNPSGSTAGITEAQVTGGTSKNPNRTNIFYINQTPIDLSGGQYKIILDNAIPQNLAVNGLTVYFYARSTIATGSHTFEYVGTGTQIYYNGTVTSLPAFGGVAVHDNEVCFPAKNGFDSTYGPYDPGNGVYPYDPAIVYYTSSNEIGNFNVGPNFQVQQSTGVISGDTFNKAIITLVSPISIVLE